MGRGPTVSSAGEQDFVSTLGERIDLVLRSHVPPGSRCALVDFENSSNVGDSAIWLGQTSYLRRSNASVVYACDTDTYSEDALRTRLVDGVILITGGGNMGDLYPAHQRLREQIIERFRRNKIIQLPQTFSFRDRSNLERARAIFDGHPDLTLLARDERSLEFARTEFRAASELCPDMAFALGKLTPPVNPDHDVVWLGRSDEESSDAAASAGADDVIRADWVEVPPDSAKPPLATRAAFRANSLLTRMASGHPDRARRLSGLLAATYAPLARQRLERGCRLLSRGRVIVTERLHGHIIGVLLGIPQVLVGDRYGKLQSFYETWTRDCTLTSWAESGGEALERARALATSSAGEH
jgi:exopolysaccharide biosynthesis predicted pyruvyltransferase EpsI